MVRVKETYIAKRKGTGRPDNLSKNMSFTTDPTDIWGNIVSLGNAELAARLGSINTYDRRGDTLWMDDFEAATLKWPIDGDGTGWGVALSTTYARNGGQSVKLVTGDEDGDSTQILKYVPLPRLSTLGFELSFTANENMKEYYFRMVIFTGTRGQAAMIYYYPQTNTLVLIDEKEDPQPIATIRPLIPLAGLFHTFKMVVDYKTKKFLRCMLDNVEYDISSYSYPDVSDPTFPHVLLSIQVMTNVASNQTAYVDDVIITQNEP